MSWPWSALTAPSPCGAVVPRGSGGREKRQQRGAKGTEFPIGECRVPGHPLLPSARPPPLSHAGFGQLPRSLQLLSPALGLSWSLGLLETEGSRLWRGERDWGGTDSTAERLCSGPRKVRIF